MIDKGKRKIPAIIREVKENETLQDKIFESIKETGKITSFYVVEKGNKKYLIQNLSIDQLEDIL